MKKLVLAVALAACATASRPAGSPPETEITVTDELGEPMLGRASFWSRNHQEDCELYGASCAVALPTGDYSLTFRKERAGRPGSSIGGTVQSEKLSGCLRARVHINPGTKITCKKAADFNCTRGVYETMDCGKAAAVLYGYKPRPGDEPPPDNK